MVAFKNTNDSNRMLMDFPILIAITTIFILVLTLINSGCSNKTTQYSYRLEEAIAVTNTSNKDAWLLKLTNDDGIAVYDIVDADDIKVNELDDGDWSTAKRNSDGSVELDIPGAFKETIERHESIDV